MTQNRYSVGRCLSSELTFCRGLFTTEVTAWQFRGVAIRVERTGDMDLSAGPVFSEPLRIWQVNILLSAWLFPPVNWKIVIPT